MKVEAVATDRSADFVARLESTLEAALDEARGRRAPWWRRWRRAFGSTLAMRAALASALAVTLVLGTGFVAVEASADAIPGDTLYPVKQARETVERWLARSDAARLDVDRRQLDRRTDELARAVEAARDSSVDRLEGTIGHNVREMVDRALALEASGNTTAVPRAREALLDMGRRVRSFALSARTPEQRQTLVRVSLFLRTQLARLDRVAGTDNDRPADQGDRPSSPDTRPLPQNDAPTSTPAPAPTDRRDASPTAPGP